MVCKWRTCVELYHVGSQCTSYSFALVCHVGILCTHCNCVSACHDDSHYKVHNTSSPCHEGNLYSGDIAIWNFHVDTVYTVYSLLFECRAHSVFLPFQVLLPLLPCHRLSPTATNPCVKRPNLSWSVLGKFGSGFPTTSKLLGFEDPADQAFPDKHGWVSAICAASLFWPQPSHPQYMQRNRAKSEAVIAQQRLYEIPVAISLVYQLCQGFSQDQPHKLLEWFQLSGSSNFVSLVSIAEFPWYHLTVQPTAWWHLGGLSSLPRCWSAIWRVVDTKALPLLSAILNTTSTKLRQRDRHRFWTCLQLEVEQSKIQYENCIVVTALTSFHDIDACNVLEPVHELCFATALNGTVASCDSSRGCMWTHRKHKTSSLSRKSLHHGNLGKARLVSNDYTVTIYHLGKSLAMSLFIFVKLRFWDCSWFFDRFSKNIFWLDNLLWTNRTMRLRLPSQICSNDHKPKVIIHKFDYLWITHPYL